MKGIYETYRISTLDQEQGQRDQKLLTYTPPLNRLNQQPKLYALYGQKAADRDKNRHYITLLH